MCIREVYTEIYPNNIHRRQERLLTCAEIQSNRQCRRVLSVERTPLYLPFPEAPSAMGPHLGSVVSEQSNSQRSTLSRSSSGKTKRRPSLKKNTEFIVELNLPGFGRRKKRHSRRESDDTTVVMVPDADYDFHGNQPPVPPPAPHPPNSGHYHPEMLPDDGDYAFRFPPPQYREDWRPRDQPVIVQVSPPPSPARLTGGPASPARPPARSPEPRPRSSGDRHLREQVEQARREHQRSQEERRRATAERREAAELNRRTQQMARRTNLERERAQQAHDEEVIRQRNVAQEQRAMARDRERHHERDDLLAQRDRVPRARSPRRYELDRVAATRDALVEGTRVFHPLSRRRQAPVDVHYHHHPGDNAYRSSSEDGYYSAPGDTRIYSTRQHRRRHRNDDAREHGERVLDSATRWWQRPGQ
ncbi:MAG: hypothetical protein M1837_006145 [Sclerophora amabilis]|nr:MAG: hypothetical protein M1837_006145 [Sclerophora amabilis]